MTQDYAVQNKGASPITWGATGALAGAGTGTALAKWANVGIPTQAYKSWDEAVAAVNKDDKFIKRKGLGRIEQTDANGNSLWLKTDDLWLDLYKNKREVAGLSVMHRVTWKDEWLAEAYMETDYSTLVEEDFQKVLNDYLSYLVKNGGLING